jgi:hypothetical protein
MEEWSVTVPALEHRHESETFLFEMIGFLLRSPIKSEAGLKPTWMFSSTTPI